MKLTLLLWLALAAAIAHAQAPAPAPDPAGDAACRARLKNLGGALAAYQLLHNKKLPARLSDLYTGGLIESLGDFVNPASTAKITSAADIDANGDFTLEPLPELKDMLVREKAPRAGLGAVLALLADGSIKEVPMAAAPTPATATVTPTTTPTTPPTTIPAATPTTTPPATATTPPATATTPPATATTPPPVITSPPPVAAKVNVPATLLPASLPPATATPPPPPGFTILGVPPAPSDFAMAHALYAAGRHAEALVKYDAALASDPNDRAALYERAAVRGWLNDVPGALADLVTLSARDPADLGSRRTRAAFELVVGDPRAGLAEAEALLQLEPNNAWTLVLHGQACLWNDNSAGAAQSFARALQIEPATVQSLLGQASQFLAAGVPGVALLQYTTVLWMDPRQYNALYGLGFACAKLGHTDRAIAAFTQYLQYDSTSDFALVVRMELERLGRQ